MTVYLVHVDESGDEFVGTIHVGVMVPMENWSHQLGVWLRHRRWMFERHGVPADFHFHANEWLAAKGQPSSDVGNVINRSKGLRRNVYVSGLKNIRSASDLVIFSRHTAPPMNVIGNYAHFVEELDAELRRTNDHAILIVDGGKKDSPVHQINQVHRDLRRESRHIIEDAWHQPADTSQFVQVADIVAHTLFRAHKDDVSEDSRWWFRDHFHDKELICRCP